VPAGSPERRHRAATPAAAALPRSLRRVLGAGGLTVLLAGSLGYAALSTSSGEDAPGQVEQAAVPGLEDRSVWSQVSRSGGGGERESLDFLESEPVTFSVTIDGEELQITSGAGTLADALIDNGILVGLDDEVNADMNQPPEDGAEIEIMRVGTVYGADTEEIPYETEERRTDDLPQGETEVETEGVPGARVTSYAATYEDGTEVSRSVQAEILASEPVTEVVLVGTAQPQATTSSSGSSGSGGSAESGSSDSGSSDSSSSSDAPTGSYEGSDPRGIAQAMVSDRGWGGDQWSCLDRLWERESNWNPHAQNPSSGAYGIPQSLPGNKMASAGSDWQTNPATQITWGLNYIEGRYGNPCGAWAHSEAHNWY